MTTTEKFHLAAFRTACRAAGVTVVIGDITLTAIKARRKPDPLKLPPGGLSDSPEAFTCALEDFAPLGLPVRGNEVETPSARYRIVSLDTQFPLLVLNCTAGVSL